jgi:hypothetical protein
VRESWRRGGAPQIARTTVSAAPPRPRHNHQAEGRFCGNISACLTNAEGELKSLRLEFAPRFVAILTNAESEISGVLTPEQRERFKKFREENRQLWQPKWVTSPSIPVRTQSVW